MTCSPREDATSVKKFHADSLYYFKIYAGGTSTVLREIRETFFLATNFPVDAPSHFQTRMAMPKRRDLCHDVPCAMIDDIFFTRKVNLLSSFFYPTTIQGE